MKTTCLDKFRSSFGVQIPVAFAHALLLLVFVTGSSSAQSDTALNGPGNVFLTANLLGTGGGGPAYVAVADFNNDGHADFVVANGGTTSIGVLLGKGDGTFQTPIVTSLACNPSWVVTGDFNGDGKPDVAVVGGPCLGSSGLLVLLGNGDGTFTTPPKTSLAVPSVQSVAVADFNGDGKLDLAVVTDGSPDTVLILLGKGDGTFNAPIPVSLGASVGSYQAVVADFNKDGHADLAISEKEQRGISDSLGKRGWHFSDPDECCTSGARLWPGSR